jgi:hypothetical protein
VNAILNAKRIDKVFGEDKVSLTVAGSAFIALSTALLNPNQHPQINMPPISLRAAIPKHKEITA